MTTVEPNVTPPPPPPAVVYQPPSGAPPIMLARADKPTATLSELIGLLAAGLAVNYVVRIGVASLVTTVAVLLVGGLLLASKRVEQTSARLLIIGAMALSPWFMIRSSAGLSFVTLIAVGGLLSVGVGVSKVGLFQRLSVFGIVNHLVGQSLEWAYGLGMIRRMFAGRKMTTQWSAFLRGVVVAIPVVGLFALLLASADEVFASVLSVEGLPNWFGHVFTSMFFAIVLLGLVSRAAHRTEPFAGALGRFLSPVEVNVVLGAVLVLFGAFVATQVAVAVGGVDHVLDTVGLTQAEHARSGFFQLLWVAALTLGMLGSIRAVRAVHLNEGDATDDEAPTDGYAEAVAAKKAKRNATGTDRFVPLAIGILTLTVVITGISIQRLLYYVGSFGLTPLRFWALVGAAWIGLLLVGYAVTVARSNDSDDAEPASWFPAFVVASAAVLVFGLNVVNPDSFVTRHNLTELAADTVDEGQLGRLSADNIGAIEANMDKLNAGDSDSLVQSVCGRYKIGTPNAYGLLGWNWAESQEQQFAETYCANAGR